MSNVKHTDSLLFKFGLVFLVFTLVTMSLSGFAAYINQMELYRQQCAEQLKNIANYLSELLIMDGDDFTFYQSFCLEYGSEMQIPIDFTSPDEARSKFELMFDERYPGKVLGENITFEELDHDLQLAYAEYNHEYYLLEFEKAAEQFGIAYAYYIVPEPWLGSDVVMYLLDCAREGREYAPELIDVCSSYPQVIERHGILWEAWNTGRSPNGYDTFDNEYGKTYAYYTPLYINGQKLGLIATEVDIDAVNHVILTYTVIQTVTIGAVLIICVVLMLLFINKRYIRPISRLESGVREYASDKNVSVAEKLEANAVGKNEISSLSRQTAEMVRELDTFIANVQAMTADKVRTGADLNVATKIQADMLPKDFFPERGDLDIFAAMIPAKEVGGDFYDLFRIDSDHIGLVMADVSGKGVPAALFMVIAKTLLQDRALMGRSPARVLEYSNNRLCASNNAGLFVTAWLGVLEISTGLLTFANAGHEYPAFRSAGGKYELRVGDNCPPLATMEDLEYEDEKIILDPGDSLFLYTDGVPEAKSVSGERFGTDRMLEILNKYADESAKDILVRMKNEVDEFDGDNDPFDDVTMMCVKYFGKRK